MVLELGLRPASGSAARPMSVGLSLGAQSAVSPSRSLGEQDYFQPVAERHWDQVTGLLLYQLLDLHDGACLGTWMRVSPCGSLGRQESSCSVAGRAWG